MSARPREEITTTTLYYDWDGEKFEWVLKHKTVETIDQEREVAPVAPYQPAPPVSPYQPYPSYPYRQPIITSHNNLSAVGT